jgi:hypothetical protein
MLLNDVVFNWLQMKIVSEARPDDQAAQETLEFFDLILREDHLAQNIQVQFEGEHQYLVTYIRESERVTQRIDREAVEMLLTDINSNPKYN